MARNQWHMLNKDGAVTHSRRLPPRFDVVAEADLPLARKGRIATQIRQDMWRALRDLRGFSPVVEVTQTDAGLHVRAGGAVAGQFDRANAVARIAAVLVDPNARARWLRHAAVRT